MATQTFFRAVPVLDLALKDGPRPNTRQLTGRLVPYDTAAWVADPIEDKPGKFDIYQEGFRRGAFDGQLVNGQRNKGVISRIGLIHRHEGGLGYLGPFIGLRDATDGLYGDINVLPTKADDVGALLEAGIDELSIEFRLRNGDNTITDAMGVRWRTSAHLDQVALEPKGAYRTAQVLQYRAEMDELAQQEAEQTKQQEQEDEAAKAEAARLAEESAKAEAEAEATMERKRAYAEMLGRLTLAEQEQQRLIKDYGVTRPMSHHSA